MNRIWDFLERRGITPFGAAAAVTATGVFGLVLGIILNAEFPQYFEISIPLIIWSIFLLILSFYLWLVYFGRKSEKCFSNLEKLNAAKERAEFYPGNNLLMKSRFDFDRDLAVRYIDSIAKRNGLTAYMSEQAFEILAIGRNGSTKLGYNFDIYDADGEQTAYVGVMPSTVFISFPHITFRIDDDMVRTNLEPEFDSSKYIMCEAEVGKMSDDEIFSMIDTIISAMTGFDEVSYNAEPMAVYRKYYTPQSYTFNITKSNCGSLTLSAANFKFIINGGTENG